MKKLLMLLVATTMSLQVQAQTSDAFIAFIIGKNYCEELESHYDTTINMMEEKGYPQTTSGYRQLAAEMKQQLKNSTTANGASTKALLSLDTSFLLDRVLEPGFATLEQVYENEKGRCDWEEEVYQEIGGRYLEVLAALVTDNGNADDANDIAEDRAISSSKGNGNADDSYDKAEHQAIAKSFCSNLDGMSAQSRRELNQYGFSPSEYRDVNEVNIGIQQMQGMSEQRLLPHIHHAYFVNTWVGMEGNVSLRDAQASMQSQCDNNPAELGRKVEALVNRYNG